MILEISDDNRIHWTVRSVSALLSQGLSRKQVAEVMGIEIRTVHRAVVALRSTFNATRETCETGPEVKPSHDVTSGDNMSHNGRYKQEQFDAFYSLYPRHIGKAAALAKYKCVIKRTEHAAIMAGVRRYIAEIAKEKTEKQYIAHPATWLNQGRWDDDYNVVVKAPKVEAPKCPKCGTPAVGTMSFCGNCGLDRGEW